MDFKRLAANQWINRILLILIIALSGIVMFVINQYGLQFSTDWINPYLSYAIIVNISLAATMGVSAIALLLGFIPKPKLEEPIIKKEQTEPEPQPTPTLSPSIQTQPVIETPPKQQTPLPAPQPQPAPQVQPQPKPKPQVQAPSPKPQPAPQPVQPVEAVQEQKPKTSKQSKGNDKAANTCPSCKKAFTQPLVMLDFEGGKSKLVNVCPYCNQVLGNTEEKTE